MIEHLAHALLLLAALVAIGLLPVRALLRPLPLLPRMAWSFLAGVTVWGALLLALSHLGGVPLSGATVRPFLVALATTGLVVDAASAWRHRRRRVRAAVPWWRTTVAESWPIWLPLTLGAFVAGGLLAGSSADPVVDWDGRITWTAHARYIASASTVDAPVLHDARATVAHPRYPPLLPVVQATSLVLDGDERAMKPLYVAFWLVLLTLAWDGARRLGGELEGASEFDWLSDASTTPAVVALLAMSCAFAAFFPDGGAIGVYSDLPLGCLFGAALILLLDPAERGRAGALAGVLLGGALLAKNEGAVLAIAALAGGAVYAWRSPRDGEERRAGVRKLAWSLAPLAACGLLLASWRAAIPNRYDEQYATLASVPHLTAGLARTGTILRLALASTLDLRQWGIAWPLLALLGAATLGARSRLCARAVGITVAIAVALAGYLAAYLVTSWPVAELVPVTWGRFLEQQLLPALLLAAPTIARLVPERARRPVAAIGARRRPRRASPP